VAVILIVDDEEPVRSFLAQLFSDRYQVRVASNGGQALTLIHELRPDIVLSDVMMPVLNGAELCRRLKADVETRDIPVILMTSAGARSTDATGAEAYIAKPFDLDEIEMLVQRWMPA
jgi:CheY-like chemotaxis protein